MVVLLFKIFKAMKKRINKIIVKVDYDYDTIPDWLGKFSDTKGEFAIAVNGGHGSYEWFNADNVENMTQAKQNYKEYVQYSNGSKNFVYVRVIAKIETSCNGFNSWLLNELRTGGLYGIESEDEETIKSEGKNQIAEMKELLACLGFSKVAIEKAIVEKS